MKADEFYTRISQYIPEELRADWDNDGLLVFPDNAREIKKVLCTLDVTDEAVSYAAENGFDLIVSHHPLIFHPLTAMTQDNCVARKIMRLLDAGISVISLHTRADALDGGVNDMLAAVLGLENVTPLCEETPCIGRVGELPAPMSLDAFAMHVKKVLGAPALLLADAGREVFRVALCGGDGKEFLAAAAQAEADTYLSGRIGYHQMTDGPENGINLIEAGHFYTETHITALFARLAEEILPTAECETFSSNVILCI